MPPSPRKSISPQLRSVPASPRRKPVPRLELNTDPSASAQPVPSPPTLTVPPKPTSFPNPPLRIITHPHNAPSRGSLEGSSASHDADGELTPIEDMPTPLHSFPPWPLGESPSSLLSPPQQPPQQHLIAPSITYYRQSEEQSDLHSSELSLNSPSIASMDPYQFIGSSTHASTDGCMRDGDQPAGLYNGAQSSVLTCACTEDSSSFNQSSTPRASTVPQPQMASPTTITGPDVHHATDKQSLQSISQENTDTLISSNNNDDDGNDPFSGTSSASTPALASTASAPQPRPTFTTATRSVQQQQLLNQQAAADELAAQIAHTKAVAYFAERGWYWSANQPHTLCEPNVMSGTGFGGPMIERGRSILAHWSSSLNKSARSNLRRAQESVSNRSPHSPGEDGAEAERQSNVVGTSTTTNQPPYKAQSARPSPKLFPGTLLHAVIPGRTLKGQHHRSGEGDDAEHNRSGTPWRLHSGSGSSTPRDYRRQSFAVQPSSRTEIQARSQSWQLGMESSNRASSPRIGSQHRPTAIPAMDEIEVAAIVDTTPPCASQRQVNSAPPSARPIYQNGSPPPPILTPSTPMRKTGSNVPDLTRVKGSGHPVPVNQRTVSDRSASGPTSSEPEGTPPGQALFVIATDYPDSGRNSCPTSPWSRLRARLSPRRLSPGK